MNEIYCLKKAGIANLSMVPENIELFNQELKIKIKLLENENKLLTEQWDKNQKFHNTILDQNIFLLKHNETLHQHPCSPKSSSGNDQLSKDIFDNKLLSDK